MRTGFAVENNRILKAKKIEAVLNDYLNKEIKKYKILDIGAGDGSISSYFSKNNDVFCVDVMDQRKNKGAKFKEVKSAKLPFKNNEFDIVISNHVIEHIDEQETHLNEIKRVLKSNGICYISTPNWNFPIEPHYKLPLIHYLSKKLFIKILKVFGKYSEELYLLSYSEMKKKYSKNFEIVEYTSKILENPKKYHFSGKLIKYIPIFIIRKVLFLSPTNIFIIKK